MTPPSTSTTTTALESARSTLLARAHARRAAPTPALPLPLSRLPTSLTLPLSSLLTLLQSRTGTSPPLRVTQLDASLLDTELTSLLTTQVSQALKYVGDGGGGHVFDEWAEEVAAGMGGVLWWLGVWQGGASYGGRVLGWGMFDARSEGGRERGRGLGKLSAWQKALYGVGEVGGGYLGGKWEGWAMSRLGVSSAPSLYPTRPQILTTKTFQTQSTLLTSVLPTLHLTNTLFFLLHGTYPTLLHRILRIRLAPLHGNRHSARDISFEYLNRQLVWHAFTEFLLFLLPLVGVARWRRWIGRAWRKMRLQIRRAVGGGKAEDREISEGGKLAMLPERTCGICWEEQNAAPVDGGAMVGAGGGGGVVGSSETDVTNPYEGVPCGCVYCYVCLAGKLEGEEGEGWVCLRCGEVVREGRVWRGDVVEEKGSGGGEDAATALDEGDKGESRAEVKATAPFKTEWAQDESDSGVDVTNG